MNGLRVAGAQLNLRVGDIDGNVDRIRRAMTWAEAEGADVLLLPELAVTGYPPEDLLLRPGFIAANLDAITELAATAGSVTTVVGFVDRVNPRNGEDAVERTITNAAAILSAGAVQGVYHKVLLPNYGVFDEARYFAPGDAPSRVWAIPACTVGVSVCEDIWSSDGPPGRQARAGADVLLNINGSPYHIGKGSSRVSLLSDEATRCGVPLVYLNLVGGQDELVFDGDSMVFDGAGELVYRAAQFEEEQFVVELEGVGSAGSGTERLVPEPPAIVPRLDPVGEVYGALVAGLRDYVRKNGFSEVVIGLSGGIDSALTCALAVDALGADAVWGVSMPSRYSSAGSIDDSRDLAERLGCRFDVIAIDDVFSQYLSVLADVFAGTSPGVAEENLQARIRGAVLMALSNKHGGMVVATGNKSEMAVGYATLYGDMAGGYAVLKDVLKTLVYELAEWRNRADEVIPRAIIDKEPSAELRPNQRDSDSLPPYAQLDAVLERYVDRDMSVERIVAEGFDDEMVHRIARLVDRNEYKRRQAAPGVRITQKGFGKDRRLPITNGYRG